MRIPKYRVWHKGKMYQVTKLDLWGDPDQNTCKLAFEGEELFEIYLHEVKLMQSTGLHDKNGVVYVDNGYYTYEIIEKVIFKQGQYGIEHGDLYRDFCSLSDFYKTTKTKYISNIGEVATESEPTFEVIGNIYDNPELLEV